MNLWELAKGAIYNMVTGPTRKDIDALIKIIAGYQLVSWDADEVDQLSRGHEKLKIRRVPRGITHGVYQSIYHEPLFAYAKKVYGDKTRQLVVARISREHFAFNTKGKIGSFDSDSGVKGKIDLSLGLTMTMDKFQLFIDTSTQGDIYEVTVNGIPICFINRNKEDSLSHLRVVRDAKPIDPRVDKLLQLAVTFGLIDNRI